MAEDTATGRRPRRAAAKAAAANATQPSAMHYVGYVEEDETPEQSMAKFEQLGKIQREAEEAKKAAAEAKRAAAEENGDVVDEELIKGPQEGQLLPARVVSVYRHPRPQMSSWKRDSDDASDRILWSLVASARKSAIVRAEEQNDSVPHN